MAVLKSNFLEISSNSIRATFEEFWSNLLEILEQLVAEATATRLRRSIHKCSWQNGLERFDPLTVKLFLIICLFH